MGGSPTEIQTQGKTSINRVSSIPSIPRIGETLKQGQIGNKK